MDIIHWVRWKWGTLNSLEMRAFNKLQFSWLVTEGASGDSCSRRTSVIVSWVASNYTLSSYSCQKLKISSFYGSISLSLASYWLYRRASTIAAWPYADFVFVRTEYNNNNKLIYRHKVVTSAKWRWSAIRWRWSPFPRRLVRHQPKLQGHDTTLVCCTRCASLPQAWLVPKYTT